MSNLYKGTKLVSNGTVGLVKDKVYKVKFIDNDGDFYVVVDGYARWFTVNRYKEFFNSIEENTKGDKMKKNKIVEVINAEVLNLMNSMLYINDADIATLNEYNDDAKAELNRVINILKKKELKYFSNLKYFRGKACGIISIVRGLELEIDQKAWGFLRYLELSNYKNK